VSRRRRRPAQQDRPQSNGPDVRQIIQEELTKALALPAGATATNVTAGYLQQLQQAGSPRISGTAALSRDPYNNVSFGPGVPLFPAPIDPLLPSGRPAPRRSEFDVSWNLQTTTTRNVPWSVLRDAADQVSVMRSCIEVNKSAITGLQWSFEIDSGRAQHLAKRAGTSSHAVTSDLQDKYADDMDRLHQWWQTPDRINNWTFSEWLGALLEDQLVLDAVALYPHMQMNGDLHSLELLDATTIKPLLDHRGATPQPPYAAFQQILWGFPRGEYAQSPPEQVDASFVSAIYGRTTGIEAGTDALIYKVRNRRTRSPYGFSNVEQALVDVDLWLKRFDWLRSEYTAGVTPEMIVGVDANMTPEQLRSYEAVFNDDLSGRTAERHRARFLPAGFTTSYPQSHDAKFNSDFDLHLIRLICAAFDVLPTSIGFSPNHGMGGMGGQGHQQGEQDSQLQRGTKPTATWITDLVNKVCVHYLGMPPEVTFRFHGLDQEDEQKEATLLGGYVNGGLKTLNEGRDQLSLPRYDFEEANQPFLSTPTGPAFLNVEVQPVGMPGNLPSAAQNQPQSQPAKEPASTPEPQGEQAQDAKRTEQKAFMTFLRKRAGGAWRDFTFTAHPQSVAEAANRLAAAGDVDAVKALFAMNEGD
jgi:hypothetical protein